MGDKKRIGADSDLNGKIKQYEDEIVKLKSELTGYELSSKDNQQNLEDAHEREVMLKDQMSKKENEMEQMILKNDNLMQQMDDCKEQLRDAVSAMSELRKDAHEIDELHAVIDDLNTVNNELHGNINDLKTNMNEIEMENKKLLGQIDAMNKHLTDENEKISVERRASTLNEEKGAQMMTQLNAVIKAKDKMLESIKKHNTQKFAEYESEINALTKEKHELIDKQNEFQQLFSTKDNDLKTLMDAKQTQAETIDELQEKIKIVEGEMSKLNTLLKASQTETSKLMKEKSDLMETMIDKENGMHQSSVRDIDAKNEEIKQLRQEMDAMKQEKGYYQEWVDKNKECNALQRKSQEFIREIQKLKQFMKSMGTSKRSSQEEGEGARQLRLSLLESEERRKDLEIKVLALLDYLQDKDLTHPHFDRLRPSKIDIFDKSHHYKEEIKQRKKEKRKCHQEYERISQHRMSKQEMYKNIQRTMSSSESRNQIHKSI